MKIIVLGSDGYIGKPLSLMLKGKGHTVVGIDNISRRRRATHSLVKLSEPDVDEVKNMMALRKADISGADAIVHLAEQPSAPYSMQSCDYATLTQSENVLGTLRLLWLMKDINPDAHLVKLGSMGEYGTPSCRIPEGFIEAGVMTGLPFPKQPNSFYHLSKVFDSQNIEFACRTWGLRSTDIMQGVVFGMNSWDDKGYHTRFDYDEHFGTVINRFCVQALAEVPLTVYGKGGQTRGYLPLMDSIMCLGLAIENPPEPGEYRVFNQYAETSSVYNLAKVIVNIALSLGYNTHISTIQNPRTELESHLYETSNDKLRALGYDPQWDLKTEIHDLLLTLEQFKDNIDTDVILPTTNWR